MSRNPFGVQDVPDPHPGDVTAFAHSVRLTGSADDANAEPWNGMPALVVRLANKWGLSYGVASGLPRMG